MRRAPLPMPAFSGTGITGLGEPPTLTLAQQLEAASVAARETAADRERLTLENARLRGVLREMVAPLAHALDRYETIVRDYEAQPGGHTSEAVKADRRAVGWLRNAVTQATQEGGK